MESAGIQQLAAEIGELILAARGRVSTGAEWGFRVSTTEPDARWNPRQVAGLIDHTILRPDATRAEILKLCAEAREFGFASVCVNPYWVPAAAAALRGTSVPVCTVNGFPFGMTSTPAKVAEAEISIRTGAREVDMVLNVGAMKSGDFDTVKLDIQAMSDCCHRGGAILKVILETALLTDNEKAIACVLAKMAGADFVKTSTGFSKSGATARDIALMRRVVGAELGVKASGGIRTLDDLKIMVEAGATRIGASASVAIARAAR